MSCQPPPLCKTIDIFGAVEELHDISAKEMKKLLKESSRLPTLRLRTGRGIFIRVDLQKLVLGLPLHLLACVATRRCEPRLRYLLRGVRLLHSLSDLSLHYPKLDQIFRQNVTIRQQIMDLIAYILIALAGPQQDCRLRNSTKMLHVSLVACSLHLLPAFIAAEWTEIVPVLLAHPKVDIFMDAAFDAVRRAVGLLHSKLRVLNSKLIQNKVTVTVAESMAQVIAQQCEASVQVLQSLSQPIAFRDRVLTHTELCKHGGLLRLALVVLRLQIPILLTESKYLVSLICRIKSKVLALMVQFCETESVSFLDEIAAHPKTMRVAQAVAVEVLSLVKKALLEEPPCTVEPEGNEVPCGLMYIHAMHLADIFSDDSNFHTLVMDHITSDLADVLASSPSAFMSTWCNSYAKGSIENTICDPILMYDPFRAAGLAMLPLKNSILKSTKKTTRNSPSLPDVSSGCCLSTGKLNFSTYSNERSSLFVKIMANLHCFDPEVCTGDVRDRFLSMFLQHLVIGPLTPGNSSFFMTTVQTTMRVCENLLLLLDHASSLSNEAVSDEDLQLVSNFYSAVHEAMCPAASEPGTQDDPMIAYLRDAHEQKRSTVLSCWRNSKRWQRVHAWDPLKKEDTNDDNSGPTVKDNGDEKLDLSRSSQMPVKRKLEAGVHHQEFPMRREYLQPIKNEFLTSDPNNMQMNSEAFSKLGITNVCHDKNGMDWPNEHQSSFLRVEGNEDLDEISIANIIKSISHKSPDE